MNIHEPQPGEIQARPFTNPVLDTYSLVIDVDPLETRPLSFVEVLAVGFMCGWNDLIDAITKS